MGVLYLVRHGQASSWEDYDRLSPLGEEQATRLGEHWASAALGIDHVYVGPRRRHRQTHDAVAAIYRGRGLPWPEPVLLDSLDEFPAAEILARFLPALARRDGEVRDLADRLGRGEASGRTVAQILHRVGRAWSRAELADPEVETWQAFRARVGRAVERMIEVDGSGRTVVAFTSGGPLAAAAGLAVGAGDEKTYDLAWTIRNGAWVELLFSKGRLTLRTFNGAPHLADPGLVSYR